MAEVAYLNRGWSAIQWASKNGNIAIAKLLINRGALKPFIDADKDGKKDGGVQYNAQYTPMHWSAHFGHVAISMLLLRHEIHVYDTDR